MSIVKHLIVNGVIQQGSDSWHSEYCAYLGGDGSASFVSKYFDSVETTGSGTSTRVNFKINGNTALYMGEATGISTESGVKAWGISIPNGEHTSEALGQISTAMLNPTIYTCLNATVISARHNESSYGSSTYSKVLIVTKNNRGITTMISKYGNSGQGGLIYQGIKCYAMDDDVFSCPRSDISFAQIESNQCQLIPFTTSPGPGVLSYTPNVFYMTSRNGPVSDAGENWFEVTFEGYKYLTNGYFAIKDDPAT